MTALGPASEIRTRLRANARQLGLARLRSKPASYRGSEKTGLSESRRSDYAIGEAQRSSLKQRHDRPKRTTGVCLRVAGGGSGTGFQHSLRSPSKSSVGESIAEGEELEAPDRSVAPLRSTVVRIHTRPLEGVSAPRRLIATAHGRPCAAPDLLTPLFRADRGCCAGRSA
jgi:hypothetical protein